MHFLKKKLFFTDPLDLPITKREHFNRWYSASSYYLALVTTDIPVVVSCCLFYISIIGILTNQPLETFRVFNYIIIAILTSFTAQSLGLLMGSMFELKVGKCCVHRIANAFLRFSIVTACFDRGRITDGHTFTFWWTFHLVCRHSFEFTVAVRHNLPQVSFFRFNDHFFTQNFFFDFFNFFFSFQGTRWMVWVPSFLGTTVRSSIAVKTIATFNRQKSFWPCLAVKKICRKYTSPSL